MKLGYIGSLTASALVLISCSASEVQDAQKLLEFAAGSIDVTNGQGLVTVGGTPANPTFTVNGTAIAAVVPRDASNMNALSGSKFKQYDNNTTAFFLYSKGTDGAVVVAASENAGTAYATAKLIRDSTTTVPTTGTAQFKGDYAGYITSRMAIGAAPNDVDLLMTGDVTLNAGFEAMTLSGAITGRQAADKQLGIILTGRVIEDVMLDTTTADLNGVFKGTTSGGGYGIGANTNGTSTGIYTAIFTGNEAASVLGGVVIPHNSGVFYPANGAVEVGGFIADKQ